MKFKPTKTIRTQCLPDIFVGEWFNLLEQHDRYELVCPTVRDERKEEKDDEMIKPELLRTKYTCVYGLQSSNYLSR